MSFYGKIKNRYKRIGGKDMEERLSQITEEELKQMSIEEIADLKVETENMLQKLESIIEMCDEALNS